MVEDNKKKTKVAKNQYDPKFDETFNFVVLEWDVAYIEVNVKNATTLMYGDRSFGEVRIPVSDVVSASGFMEKEHKIVGRRTDSFIKFREGSTPLTHLPWFHIQT